MVEARYSPIDMLKKIGIDWVHILQFNCLLLLSLLLLLLLLLAYSHTKEV